MKKASRIAVGLLFFKGNSSEKPHLTAKSIAK